jgi:hypothetical protein
MPWRPTNCAVQRSFRDESAGDGVKVTAARPGGIFRRQCIVPIKAADGIDQTEFGAKALRPASTADDSRIVPSAGDEDFEYSMRGCDTALTQSDRLMPKQETLLKLFIKSYLS